MPMRQPRGISKSQDGVPSAQVETFFHEPERIRATLSLFVATDG